MSAGDLPSIARVSPWASKPRKPPPGIWISVKRLSAISAAGPRMTCGRPTRILMQVSQGRSVAVAAVVAERCQFTARVSKSRAIRWWCTNARAIDGPFRAKLRTQCVATAEGDSSAESGSEGAGQVVRASGGGGVSAKISAAIRVVSIAAGMPQ